MRTMYDSLDLSAIPADATMVAGYVNGRWPNFNDVVAKWPKAIHVSIAVSSIANAMVLDVETGDATPAQAPVWVQRQRQDGRDPTIYCNTSTWPVVEAVFRNAAIGLPHWWQAQYDGVAELTSGAVAKQYLGYPGNSPGHYDRSCVAGYWPGVDLAPPPTPQQDATMTMYDSAHASDADRDEWVRTIYVANFGEEPSVSELNFCKWCLGAGATGVAKGVFDSAAGQAARLKRSPQPTA